MRIIIVSPRFGPSIVGGAERGAREYAQRLALRGHQVTVHTTTADDHFEWRPRHPEGESADGAVRVVRHDAVAPDLQLRARLQLQVDSGLRLGEAEQRAWLHESGESPSLLDAIEREGDDADVILFTPYLFAHTVLGARIHPHKSVVVPCLHDEPYAYWETVQSTLSSVAGLIFNSSGEQLFAAELLGEPTPHRVVGFGVEAPAGDATRFVRNYGARPPYIAYAGRRERGKGFVALLEWTMLHNDHMRRGDAVQLAVMGSGQSREMEQVARHVLDCGFVTEQTKQDALAGAVAAVNLSTLESFSFLLMESWLAGSPVIVNARGVVTREHCRASGGGLWVDTAEEYSAAIDRLTGDDQLRVTMARRGRDYVETNYTWPRVLDKLEPALAELAA